MSEDKNLFYIFHNFDISQYTDSGFHDSLQTCSCLRLLLVYRVFYVSKQEVVKLSGDRVTTEIKISNSVTQPNIYVLML